MYTPEPVDTSSVTLPEDLLELAELIAANVHDVWAAGRIREGWTYGPVRDDAKKQTPCLVPYDALPEAEKDYDRNTAMETIKLMVKLGYSIQRQKPVPREMEQAEKIRKTCAAFGIHIGALEEVRPESGCKWFVFSVAEEKDLRKLLKLRDDISLQLSIPNTQFICPVPGKMAFAIAIADKEKS